MFNPCPGAGLGSSEHNQWDRIRHSDKEIQMITASSF